MTDRFKKLQRVQLNCRINTGEDLVAFWMPYDQWQELCDEIGLLPEGIAAPRPKDPAKPVALTIGIATKIYMPEDVVVTDEMPPPPEEQRPFQTYDDTVRRAWQQHMRQSANPHRPSYNSSGPYGPSYW